jgi:bacterioferritin-associated ferredoxin
MERPAAMYVCICNAVTDRQIRQAAELGATSLDALACSLGVGAGCGCCRDSAQRLLDDCGTPGACAQCPRRAEVTAA